MNKTKLNVFLLCACIVLVFVSAGFAFAYFRNMDKANRYEIQLENLYERNFYELIDNINNIEVNLSKLSATKDDMSRQDILDKIISQTNMAQNNMASLPLKVGNIRKTISFINQTNGYCITLSTKLARGETLSSDDLFNIDNLNESANNVKKEVNDYSMLLRDEGYKIVDNLSFDDANMGQFEQSFQSLEEPAVEYPELIFDGPFADSLMRKEIKGLGENTIGQQEAEALIKKCLEPVRIEFLGVNEGKFATLNFKAYFSNDSNAFIQVTQKGGMLLSINRTFDKSNKSINVQQCIENAKAFAEKVGIKDMEAVWWQENSTCVYVNLAPIVDNVIYYPDLIKVCVNFQDGDINGWEATNYAYNHTERALPKGTISPDDAEKNLPEDLSVLSVKKAIIPGEYVGEIYAYEFKCSKNDNLYFIYVDALSGQQVKIMRVVDTEEGQLLL